MALLILTSEAQKKKHLTAEEHAMRRAEMARRRKNLSEKRNEEEKVRWSSNLILS
jgi:Ino eighty subunit 2